ncbi:DUF3592 domain-containing protein [Microbacterium indicum]|uniref:DUF3592 domain-containing protein n=1 Tax=Microbacterium indicum TaxID=358100 RepID=UPI000423526B|nr:DUF3592 domain-containing protein [Microbacterium indicum]
MIEPVTHRIGRGYARRQDWARIHGTPATATVTKADMDIVNDRYRWKATLKYEDAEGRTRWHTASIPTAKADKPRVGDRYTVRYGPEHPGRRASIHVNLARPLNRRGR